MTEVADLDIVDKMVAEKKDGHDIELVGNPFLDAHVAVLQQFVTRGFSIFVFEGKSIVVCGEVVHLFPHTATIFLNKCTVMCAEQPCGYFAGASENECAYHFDYESLGGSGNFSQTVNVEGRLLETFDSLTKKDREERVCEARKCQKEESQEVSAWRSNA